MFKPRLSLTLTSLLSSPEWHHVALRLQHHTVSLSHAKHRKIRIGGIYNGKLWERTSYVTFFNTYHPRAKETTSPYENSSRNVWIVDHFLFSYFLFLLSESFTLIFFLSVLSLPWLCSFTECIVTKCNFILIVFLCLFRLREYNFWVMLKF